MSYTTRTIGTKTVLQDDRLLVVKEGDAVPTPATGFSIIKLFTFQGKDVYLEYKVYDGPLS